MCLRMDGSVHVVADSAQTCQSRSGVPLAVSATMRQTLRASHGARILRGVIRMVDNILQFIEQAELAAPDDSLLLSDEEFPQPQGDGPQAAVVDSNLLTYAQGTPAEVKSLIASWMLFAQRAANALVPGKEEPTAWVTAYYRVLEDTGWVIRNKDEGWTTEEVFGSQVHHNILAFATAVLGPGAAALVIVTSAIKSLDDMNKNSPWITLFDRRGRTAKTMDARSPIAARRVPTRARPSTVWTSPSTRSRS